MAEKCAPTEWTQRYSTRWEEYRLPKTEAERLALGEQVGRDGIALLTILFSEGVPAWLRQIPAVKTLPLVWLQNFYEEKGTIHWRRAGNIPPAAKAICSPFDLQAHYSIKRQTEWAGYKAHLTETCASDAPHRIVHVITTAATQQDSEVTAALHRALADKDLLPDEHLLDQGGYSDSHDLIQAHEVYGIEMIMPRRTDHAWASSDP
jgi:transposase